ncbi:LGFP repeat-containing protein [Corynebacterium resistens]|uniref:LGFP repeat-containing protein n=1 Tax=Corynebacterium resistens TaxID=258224 RepID=UPI00235631A1|nr:hypothetical protein [Corynebacterium resistens]
MARPSRTISALLFSVALSIGLAPVAQPQPAQAPTVTNAPTESNADQVAPGRENLEPSEPGFDDNTVDNQTGANWHPTVNPKDEITPGQMRSDKEEIPGGFTKEQANQAEIQEAKEQASQTRSGIQTLAAVNTCRTYWPSPYKVCGKIREKYDSLGGPQSFLTWPKSNELTVPDGVGRRNEFANGFIYWHPNTGAHPITTHFSIAWARTGWERGPLGYPTTDEFGLSDGIGRKQSFEHGHIYGSLAGLASIHGAIYDKWIQTGAEKGPLGYPVTDETKTPDGIGRFNRFTGGMIYWHPKHGAHFIKGNMLDQWGTAGYEKSTLGYPTEDPQNNGQALQSQRFQHGRLHGGIGGAPIAGTALTFSVGIVFEEDLQASVLPNGIRLESANFKTEITSDYTWDISLMMNRKNASAPRTFSFLVGMPSGYRVAHHPYRTSLISPTGDEIGAIGTPVTYNKYRQNVPMTSAVNKGLVTYTFGSPEAVNNASRQALFQNGGDNAGEGLSRTDASSKYWYENPSTGQYPVKTCSFSAFDCSRSLRAWKDSVAFSEEKWGSDLADNQGDATRHCSWMGMTTEASNADFARELADAHEKTPNNPEKSRLMDEFNNITGIATGLRNEGNPGQIKNICLEYAKIAKLTNDPASEFPNQEGNSLIVIR